jgi:glycosyltransferase involved in cell wall biosynthesis
MKPGIKVTFVAYDKPDNVGGPPAWLQRLLPALREHGIESRCLFLLHWGETGPTLEFLRARGFDCPVVPAHAATEERIHWILDRLREDPPDVFVPNLVVAAYLAARWVREAGIPTVGILHSDDPFYQGLQDRFLFGRPQDRVTAMVCVSRELERQVLERGAQPAAVTRIGYGVPVPETTVQHQPGRLRLAFVGRLAEEQKRISGVVRAFCRATREVPGSEAIIYGDGPERLTAEQLLTAEGAGLPVRMGGLIDSDRIQALMLECDVIVLLSDYEGLPIALMEAMACGCVPVCLRMRSGIPELVDDGETGLLVDDRGDGFVAAIRRLREDPALWEKLSTAARRRISDRHSTAASSRQWVDLLEKLHRGAGARHALAAPVKPDLPAVHPALVSADPRRVVVPLPIRLYRRSRIWAGRARRKLLGQPLP